MDTPNDAAELSRLLSHSRRVAMELDELLRCAYHAMMRMAVVDEDSYFHLAEVARRIDDALWDLSYRDINEH